MTDKQINELAGICTRFAEVNGKVKAAANAIKNARFEIFGDFITLEEKAVLVSAEELLNRLAGQTDQREAIKYFTELQNKQQ